MIIDKVSPQKIYFLKYETNLHNNDYSGIVINGTNLTLKGKISSKIIEKVSSQQIFVSQILYTNSLHKSFFYKT